jgi:hypothetical protein
VLAEARRLHGDHEAAARSAAGTINGVADAPYKEPGWLSRAWSSVKGWISDHADVLAKISSVLKGVSAVLGVLSLVPGLQFLAPFAIAAGGIALAIDVAVKLATGKGSWTSIGIDAALTFLPGGKILSGLSGLKGVKAAVAGEKGLVAGEKALMAGEDIVGAARPNRLAALLNDGTKTERAIFDGSADAKSLRNLWDHNYAALDDVNKARFVQDLRTGPGGINTFRHNCTRCVVTADKALDGEVVQALPHPAPGAPLADVEKALGGTFKQVPSYNNIVKQLREAGPGARGVVFIRRADGSGHVFNVIHDSRGVVFLDTQSGFFANLENVPVKMLNLYRK